MDGKRNLEDVPEVWRSTVTSLLEGPILKLALSVLQNPTHEAKTAALARLPETIRAMVRNEAGRIYKRRLAKQ